MTPDSSLQKLLPEQHPATRAYSCNEHTKLDIEDETQPWPHLECSTAHHMGANWQDQ